MLHFIKARFNYSICFVIYASLEFHVLNGLCVTCMLCFTEDISLVLIGMSDCLKQTENICLFFCNNVDQTVFVILVCVFWFESDVRPTAELHVLVYDILPSATAVFSYSIGSRKLSANEQFFCWCSNSVSLLQTTQTISDVCFITDHVAYASSDKTKIV